MTFIRTTIVGGFVFLLPLVVILVVLGKAYGIMLHLARPLERLLPVESVGGWLSSRSWHCWRSSSSVSLRGWWRVASWRGVPIDGSTAVCWPSPGYAFVKGFADHLQMEEGQTRSMQPVLVQFDDNAQLGFEIERLDSGNVVVYLPGAPDPWSGSVGYFAEGRVRPLAMTVPQAVSHIRRLGRGSDIVAKALMEARN